MLRGGIKGKGGGSMKYRGLLERWCNKRFVGEELVEN